MGSRAGLEHVERWKFCLYRVSNSDPSTIQLLASKHTELRYNGSKKNLVAAARGVPKRSSIQVLRMRNIASLRWLELHMRNIASLRWLELHMRNVASLWWLDENMARSIGSTAQDAKALHSHTFFLQRSGDILYTGNQPRNNNGRAPKWDPIVRCQTFLCVTRFVTGLNITGLKSATAV
jgi:hypothetical protein